MTSDELRSWMSQNAYTVRGLAGELRVAPTTVQRWRDGTHPVPHLVELAVRTLKPRRKEAPKED